MLKALLIGINYVDTPYKLNGCHNDVYSWKEYLAGKGYQSLTIMTDESKYRGTPYFPTSSNILTQLNAWLKASTKGDRLILTFSGHGGSLPDWSRDERDGKDEFLFGCDLSPIVDDTLNLVVRGLPEGVSLRVVLDCCHSGSGLDLPFRYSSILSITENSQPLSRDILCISGCKDEQTSADAYIRYRFQGALTYTLLETLKTTRNSTWKALIQLVDDRVKSSGYAQIPQLSYCSAGQPDKPVDI